ncbi:PEP-utilizing enzyme [Micromonospora sp. R77]|uniref:PEP/pyruvate-binding domain-containing protein n=1 Tax=Micromonospora sp. R77 TaxID=2925836 RepID=UPI001F613127|nr:PEP/pyruvate-binding domain-containing protein [Micromonospora sp. R77]MCI4061294.1 PEP-utilizing enzyme [Micromonospora sp. R77]
MTPSTILHLAAVLDLDAATDPATAGRKAATLAHLRALGLPVPDGVVLRADAGLDGRVADLLVAAAARWGDVPLAVRSSGLDEDRADASFAGLYETVLDVRGRDALLAAVERCRASASADRVARYHGSSGLEAATIAVLVQPLIDAVAAGVAFTADPVTGARDVVTIDAVRGLGERLVSGAATPEHWQVGQLATRIAPSPDGTVLTAAQAEAVADLARRAEALLEGPQDVEWALDAAGAVHLLQARPVTTLPTSTRVVVPVEVPADLPPGYWQREASHAPLPWTPVNRSWLDQRGRTLTEVCEELGLLVDGIEFRDIGGWEYQRIIPLGGKEPPKAPAWVTWLAARLAPPMRARNAAALRAQDQDLAGQWVRRWHEQWQPDLTRRTTELLAVDRAGLSDDALAAHLRDAVTLVRDGTDVHFRLHGALCMELSRFYFTCRDVLGLDIAETFRLVSGTSHRSTAPARALAEVAGLIRRSPEALARLREGAPLAEVQAADPVVAAALDAYLRDYGCRALQYDAAEPTIDERPGLILGLLRDQLEGDADPAAKEAAVARDREEALAAARRSLAGRPKADAERFERDLAAATAAYPVREDNEFATVSRPLAVLHHAALAVGIRLAERGQVDQPDDAFMLEADELIAALADRDDQREVVLRRLGERAWVLAHPGPDVYGPAPADPPPLSLLPGPTRFAMAAFLWTTNQIFPPIRPGDTTGPIHGVAGSPGIYTGTVRVVRDETEFARLRPGDVLVCPSTSPVWSVLFPSVGALVTDSGGTLSHPAIIAREYGVPAVVATASATSRLGDGDVVRVDGTNGIVTIVSTVDR